MNSFRFLSHFSQSPDGYLLETPAGVSSVASPDSGATPATATPVVTPQSATPAASPAAATSAVPEDRSNWVPPYRIRETRESALRDAQTQFAQREAEIRAEADRYRQQVLALTGVQAPPNPEVAAVKSQFSQLFPGLAKMEERSAQLEQLLERAGDIESQNDHYWQSYGRQTMDRLFTHAAESLGAPLTDEGKRQLHSSFVGFVQSSPELANRYANDPTIVEDFWKAFTSSFIDPIRRTSAAGVVNRATGQPAMPQDSGNAGLPVSQPPKFANVDERGAAAWAQYQATKR